MHYLLLISQKYTAKPKKKKKTENVESKLASSILGVRIFRIFLSEKDIFGNREQQPAEFGIGALNNRKIQLQMGCICSTSTSDPGSPAHPKGPWKEPGRCIRKTQTQPDDDEGGGKSSHLIGRGRFKKRS
ncbi:hypothetical protein ACJW30_04G156900 [Castanea mollissima]